MSRLNVVIGLHVLWIVVVLAGIIVFLNCREEREQAIVQLQEEAQVPVQPDPLSERIKEYTAEWHLREKGIVYVPLPEPVRRLDRCQGYRHNELVATVGMFAGVMIALTGFLGLTLLTTRVNKLP